MISIALCDDEREDRDLLHEHLLRYADEHHLEFQLFQYESGEDLLKHFLEDKPQIYFLDIYMSGISGVQTAQTLRKQDNEAHIIFITTSDSHYGDGFAVAATHYLMKPIEYNQVVECLRRCKVSSVQEKERTITVKVRQQELTIKHSDIYYVEAVRNSIEIHHIGGSTKVYMSFSQILEFFDYEDFLQCHRAFLVNLRNVDKVSQDCFIMQNKASVPIRQSEIARIKAFYFNFFMNTLRGRADK